MFIIQVCNPYPRPLEPNDTFYSVMDVAVSAFPNVTESWYLIWMGVSLPISYDDDFIRCTIPSVLQKMLDQPEGEIEGGPAEQSYSFWWKVSWKNAEIEIVAEWERPPCRSEIRELLKSKCSTLKLPLADFLAEWKMLLRKYIEIYEEMKKKYQINLVYPNSYLELQELVRSIPRYGSMYQDFNT